LAVAPSSVILDDVRGFGSIFVAVVVVVVVVICFGKETETFRYSVNTGMMTAEQITSVSMSSLLRFCFLTLSKCD
jgi:hypothetical protein